MIMKKLLLALLLPIMVLANPTSGWNEDYSYGDTTGDFSTFPYVLLLLAIFLGPYFISKIIDLFKSKPYISENTESEIEAKNLKDIAVEEDSFINAYKQSAKEFNKEIWSKANEDSDSNKSKTFDNRSREPIYIAIIIGLLVLMNVQYTKYREDSYSRTQNCFRDVVPADDKEYCDNFVQTYKELTIKADAVEIIEGCFEEQFSMCPSDISEYECTGTSIAFCTARHPDYMEAYLQLLDNEK